jgi:hypothetical protein
MTCVGKKHREQLTLPGLMARRPSSECPEIDADHSAADAGKKVASMSVSELPVGMKFFFFEHTDCDLPYYREWSAP